MILKIPEEIKDIFSYNGETGIITVEVKYGDNVIVGSERAHLDKLGYKIFTYKFIRYKAHRVAWFLYYGVQPTDIIDHINGNKADNRIINLRQVTTRENAHNDKRHREGRLVGARYKVELNKWESRIQNPKTKKLEYLGLHLTELEAHHAYLSRLSELTA